MVKGLPSPKAARQRATPAKRAAVTTRPTVSCRRCSTRRSIPCSTALWIETVEPGKPLGFLDANIRCGDSLLGVFDLKALALGIPDAAYKPLAGDDKETAKYFEKRNKDE